MDVTIFKKEDFDKMSIEEKKVMTVTIIDKMHNTVMTLAEALIEYGQHTEDCVTEDCTCGFLHMSEVASKIIQLSEHFNGRATVN
jgi:hypothetical protein